MGVKTITSGFVGINDGDISDCYATVTLLGSDPSFCYQNNGTITNTYLAPTSGKAFTDFCKRNNGTTQNSYLHQGEAVPPGEWDTERIWDTTGERPVFRTQFFHQNNPTPEEYTALSSPQELLTLAQQVNAGEAAAAGSYLLTGDIDLKGAKWTPLGLDELHPFTGRFDGNGYTIKNFTVVGKNLTYGGFFGYLKNSTISNLNIDCRVRAGNVSGALAGCNEAGSITCCTTAAEVASQKSAACFVGRNSGRISHCCSVGTAKPLLALAILPLALAGVALVASAALVSGLALAGVFTPAQPALPAGTQFYPEVARDPNIERNEADPIAPVAKGNSVSFEFQPEITASTGDGAAAFHFKNPGTSNQNVVVELQLSDAELLEKAGKTGRTAEEQATLEGAEGYTPESARVTIGVSGSIPPGFSIDSLQLSPLPDGSVLPTGDYNVVVFMKYYDSGTNEKAMVQSQAQGVLRIG